MFIPTLHLTANASGAAVAAQRGDVVMIVDVIDMSTTLEAAIDADALAVFGAAPDHVCPPVPVHPRAIGAAAAKYALQHKAKVALIAEPRIGTDVQRQQFTTKVWAGLEQEGITPQVILPNLGAETTDLYDLAGYVVVAATATGGVAYDAAYNAGASAVITGTVARTRCKKGVAPAQAAAKRALEKAMAHRAGITVVAASANSLEDVLAAEYIFKLLMEQYLLT